MAKLALHTLDFNLLFSINNSDESIYQIAFRYCKIQLKEVLLNWSIIYEHFWAKLQEVETKQSHTYFEQVFE